MLSLSPENPCQPHAASFSRIFLLVENFKLKVSEEQCPARSPSQAGFELTIGQVEWRLIHVNPGIPTPDYTAAARAGGGPSSSTCTNPLAYHVGTLNRFRRFMTIWVSTVRKFSSILMRMPFFCPDLTIWEIELDPALHLNYSYTMRLFWEW